MPTERRRPRRACADRAVDTHARRAVCAVCRVTSPRLLRLHRRLGSFSGVSGADSSSVLRLRHRTERRATRRREESRRDKTLVLAASQQTAPPLPVSRLHLRADLSAPPARTRSPARAARYANGCVGSSSVAGAVDIREAPRRVSGGSPLASHRRFGSVRAGTGDVERAPSRERVVVPTERRRPRRACADRAVDTHARRVVCAVCRVTSPRLLLSASHRRFGSVRAGTGDVERAPSRERVVVPTERRRPRRACADRAVDTRTRRFVRRVSSDITTPLALCVASPVRLCQSRHRRRRASAEPRASRRADRAPPTSSCVRRSRRRHTRVPCRVRRVSSDITAPLALCVASPVRLCQSRHRRRRASAEPRASRRADRAPPTSSCVRRSRRRHTRAPCRVRRVSSDITAPIALCVA